MTYFTLKDIDITNKRVLVRLGTDMPVDEKGAITDDKRIRTSVPTIKYLLEHDAQQIILMCHIDRPTERSERLSTKKTAERLGELLGETVAKIDDWGEKGLPNQKIIFLENVRFNPAEKAKDEKEQDAFGKHLASLADVFVQDAFSNLHHPEQASMTGVLPYIPACLGLGAENEIRIITSAMRNPKKPFVSIIGGMKAEKLNAVKELIEKVDHVLIGGGLAFTLLKAMGKDVGTTKVDKEGLENLKELIELATTSDKVVLPVDAVIADQFDNDARTEIVSIDNVQQGWMALDIGPKTIEKYCRILKTAKTVIFNGPPGVYEFETFAQGTKAVVETICQLPDATTVAGGGDSANAIKRFGDGEKMTLVSSGGGASLTLFEGKTLGAVDALEENHKKFKQ